MEEIKKSESEEQAFEAIIIAAFLNAACPDDPSKINKKKLAALLRDGDHAALDALGEDIVERIVSGEWTAGQSTMPLDLPAPEEADFSIAVHRGKLDTEVSEEAKKEMEEKVRQITEQRKESL